MATIDDRRAQLLAGQAARLRDEARQADELLRQGKIDEARECRGIPFVGISGLRVAAAA